VTRRSEPPPPIPPLSRAERSLIRRLDRPSRVQAWLNALPYNTEVGGETLRSFRGVARLHTAHCLEAVLFAATVLGHHGYPPLVLSFESRDNLDHVIFIYRSRGGWGSVARSRDPGLHGRKPVFASPRALARSYIEPYVDYTGRVTGYATAHLDRLMKGYDWRWSTRNVWKVEQALIDHPHRRLTSSNARFRFLRKWYRAYRAAHGGRKPIDYRGRSAWTALPREFL
jgi:hypothetical protein